MNNSKSIQQTSKYSVLMSVYRKENPKWLDIAIESMLKQTIKPDEFVMICDGPLTPELDAIIDKKTKEHKNLFKIIRLTNNVGLGPALQRGILECSNNLIARMDSDDYSMPNRIEKEMQIMLENPDIELVGTNVEEFENDISNIKCSVILPEKHDEIYAFAKKRCPFRHPSLLYKKDAVLKCGNYRKYHLCEDYDLYTRFLQKCEKTYNIQEPLVYMRISDDFYKRRGGIKYLKSILKFKKEQFSTGFFSFSDFIVSAGASTVICLSPNFIRDLFYKKILRKK